MIKYLKPRSKREIVEKAITINFHKKLVKFLITSPIFFACVALAIPCFIIWSIFMWCLVLWRWCNDELKTSSKEIMKGWFLIGFYPVCWYLNHIWDAKISM